MRAPIPRNRLDIFCRLDRGAIFIPAAFRGRNTKCGACLRTTKHHAKRKNTPPHLTRRRRNCRA